MLVTPDGRRLLVTEDAAGEDAHSPGAAGLEVFRIDGAHLTSEHFLPLPGAPEGIALVPGANTLAFGLGDSMGLLDPKAVLNGGSKPAIIPFAAGAGPHYLTVSKDGRFLFATIEYGGDGQAAIISLAPAASRSGPASAAIRAVISVPQAATGLTLSPDGSRLYVVSEVAAYKAQLSGSGLSVLGRSDCHQANSGPQRNGVLFTFDVDALLRLSAHASTMPSDFASARLGQSAAGCSPVRLAISGDGRRLYVTARGQNQVLVFDTGKLETDPEHALLNAFASGGMSPVGIQLTGHDSRLVVANSNRFGAGPGDIAVLDAASGKVLARYTAGRFPRNVATAPNGEAFVSDFGSNDVEALVPPSD